MGPEDLGELDEHTLNLAEAFDGEDSEDINFESLYNIPPFDRDLNELR